VFQGLIGLPLKAQGFSFAGEGKFPRGQIGGSSSVNGVRLTAFRNPFHTAGSQEARVTGEITTTVAPELVAALQSMPETVGRREVDLLVN
jgi:hypothetical protein